MKKNKVRLSDYMDSFKSSLGSKVYDVLATLAVEIFKEDFKDIHNTKYPNNTMSKKRPFLFSENCVSYEIELHDYAYRRYTHTSSDLMVNNVGEVVYAFTGKLIADHTGVADVFEQDAIKTSDKFIFKYYEGIAPCYQKTKADPYWNGRTRKRSYERPKWATTMIPYNP